MYCVNVKVSQPYNSDRNSLDDNWLKNNINKQPVTTHIRPTLCKYRTILPYSVIFALVYSGWLRSRCRYIVMPTMIVLYSLCSLAVMVTAGSINSHSFLQHQPQGLIYPKSICI